MAFQEDSQVPPQFSPLSIARAIWKRKLWMLAAWAAFSAITFVVVMRLPAVYHAESLILIEGQRIPERYVPATVNDELTNRLSMLTQQIKSYTALLAIIEKFNLYRDDRRHLAEEEVVAKMRNDIEVKAVQGWSHDTFPAFTIAYEGPNPVMVARVADELTQKFQDENLKMRGEQARGTSQFLESQLNEARTALETQEARLSEFRQQHTGALPEQASALLAALSRLELQLKGTQDSSSRNEQTRMMLENSLASAQSGLDAFRELANHAGDAKTGASRLGGPSSRPPTDLEKAEALLAALRTRYSEDHPDVVRTLAQIELLKKVEQQKQAIAQSSTPPDQAKAAETDPSLQVFEENPLLAKTLREQEDRVRAIQVQLKIVAEDIDAQEVAKGKVLAEIRDTQRRMEALPLVQQNLAKVIRDYDISKGYYQSLLNKRMEANVAANMETLEKAERLVLLDRPRIPEKPIKPKRELLIAMGCAGGLAFGMLLGFGMELRHGVLLGEWELPAGTSVLGRVPVAKLSVKNQQTRLTPIKTKRSTWPKARVTLRVRSPRQLVLAPTILLCLLGGALIVTTLFSGWSPF